MKNYEDTIKTKIDLFLRVGKGKVQLKQCESMNHSLTLLEKSQKLLGLISPALRKS
jgi:hypothetical protein